MLVAVELYGKFVQDKIIVLFRRFTGLGYIWNYIQIMTLDLSIISFQIQLATWSV